MNPCRGLAHPIGKVTKCSRHPTLTGWAPHFHPDCYRATVKLVMDKYARYQRLFRDVCSLSSWTMAIVSNLAALFAVADSLGLKTKECSVFWSIKSHIIFKSCWFGHLKPNNSERHLFWLQQLQQLLWTIITTKGDGATPHSASNHWNIINVSIRASRSLH